MRIVEIIPVAKNEAAPSSAPFAKTPEFVQAVSEAIAPLRAGLHALQQRVETLPQELPAPAAPPAPTTPLPDPRIDDLKRDLEKLQEKIGTLEQAWSERLGHLKNEFEEQKRAQALAPVVPVPPSSNEPAPHASPITEAPLSVAAIPAVVAPEQPPSSETPLADLPFPDLPDPPVAPGLWRRFWNYLNAPAFKK